MKLQIKKIKIKIFAIVMSNQLQTKKDRKKQTKKKTANEKYIVKWKSMLKTVI